LAKIIQLQYHMSGSRTLVP